MNRVGRTPNGVLRARRGDGNHWNGGRVIFPALRFALNVDTDEGRITCAVVGNMRHIFRVRPDVGREPYKAEADKRNDDAPDRNKENSSGESSDGVDENEAVERRAQYLGG